MLNNQTMKMKIFPTRIDINKSSHRNTMTETSFILENNKKRQTQTHNPSPKSIHFLKSGLKTTRLRPFVVGRRGHEGNPLFPRVSNVHFHGPLTRRKRSTTFPFVGNEPNGRA